MKEIKALENICPFCSKVTGEATIMLADTKGMEGVTKAIADPCLRCGKFLDDGDVGFLALDGSGIIVEKTEGIRIMKGFGVDHLYRDDKRTVVKVKDPFWKIQKTRVKKIIKKRRERHGMLSIKNK